MNGGPSRVLVADDHPAFRGGLRAILAGERGLDAVGEASTGLQAVELARELRPDAVLMDLHMPELSGIEATRRITAALPATGVVVMTMLDDDASVVAALRAGARGYLLKDAGRHELVRALHAVVAGEAILGAPIAGRLAAYIGGSRRGARPAFAQLTEREHDVLELIAAGRSNALIAGDLALSVKTVRNHVSNIFNKLAVIDRPSAIVKAREAGLGYG